MILAALLLSLAAAQSKGGYPLDHLDLVKNIKPFSTSVVPDTVGVASVSKIARYTVQVPFDQAVIKVENQLGSKIWSDDVSYAEADLDVVEEKQSNGLYVSGKIVIKRGKAIFNVAKPQGVSGVGGSPYSLAKYHFPKVDPTGWVTVSVIESISAQSDTVASRLPSLSHSTPVSYCIVSWLPKGIPSGPIDVHKGTASLEGRAGQEFEFYRSGG